MVLAMLLLVPVPRFDVDPLSAAGQASARNGFVKWIVQFSYFRYVLK